METVGQIIRAKRESLGLLLRQVASHLDIDQAILSKIERNERKPTKDNIIKLAEILKLDKEDLLVQFMSEKIAYEIQHKKSGFYHLFEFKVSGEVLIAFETEFRRDERVMRFLTVSLDKHAISWAERRRTKLKSTKA